MQGIIKGLDHAVIVYCIVANTREILSEGWKMCGNKVGNFCLNYSKLFYVLMKIFLKNVLRMQDFCLKQIKVLHTVLI